MDVIDYVGGGSLVTFASGIAYAVNKWLVPAYRQLKKEIDELRKELKEEIEKRIELESQLAYLKGKYAEKTVLKSHGKKKSYD